jgi:hypothetical protein
MAPTLPWVAGSQTTCHLPLEINSVNPFVTGHAPFSVTLPTAQFTSPADTARILRWKESL